MDDLGFAREGGATSTFASTGGLAGDAGIRSGSGNAGRSATVPGLVSTGFTGAVSTTLSGLLICVCALDCE